MDLLEIYLNFLSEKDIEIPYGDEPLGVDVDSPIKILKKKIRKGKKKWNWVSKKLTALYIYNKNKNPEIAKKWKRKKERLTKWIERKRKSDPNFGK